jgi:transcription initiation factor TFIIIB Brf1 subunit/transcription initiation factor TFIIB
MTCVYCGGDETPLTIEHGSPICADCLRVISEELAEDDADDELEPYDWTAELDD